MSNVVKVRASSWGSLFDCAMRWEAEHLLGMKKPSGPRALLGTGIHHGTAAFDAGRINDEPITPFEAAELAVNAILDPEYEVDWKADELTPNAATEIAATLVGKYCREVSPRYTFRAVELTTKPLQIDCGGGVTVELTGTLDRSRLRDCTRGVGIADIKSGGTAVSKGIANIKGHAAQIGTYELLYAHTTGEAITAPAEIIGMKTKGAPEIAIAEINGAREVMTGDGEAPGLIEYAAVMFRTGLFPPNPSSMLCSEKYCVRWNTCRFRAR